MQQLRFVAFVTALALAVVACGGAPSAAPPTASESVYVGAVQGTDALIAIVTDGERVSAYSCGGEATWRRLTAWFEGNLVPGTDLALVGEWGIELEATREGAGWRGTLSAAGTTYAFSAEPADPSGPAGLYVLLSDTRDAGLIVTNERATAGVYYGRRTGVTTTVAVAPELLDVSRPPASLVVQTTAYGGRDFTLTRSRGTVERAPVGPPALDVPTELHRVAAQLLEDVRATDMAPGWSRSARLDGVVTPFYRPDIDGVAYFEFGVAPSGFIMVSNGEHDHPLAGWGDGARVSDALNGLAAERGSSVARLYRLDAASYAAEDASGRRVALLGNEIVRVDGLERSSLTQPEVVAASSVPSGASADDSAVRDLVHEIDVPRSGAEPTYAPWPSWTALKDGYGRTYEVWLEQLRASAADDWATDAAAREHGEGLVTGQTFAFATLYPGARHAVSPGAEAYASVDLVAGASSDMPGVLRITTSELSGSDATPFTVDLAYRNGVTERLTFVVVPAPTVPAEAGSAAVTTSSWTTLQYFQAGTWGQQRAYSQFPYGDCVVGCGPVAWAMLFGWADNQAAIGNAMWAPRWGLYRAGGGYGADAVAPQLPTVGVDTVVAELNDRMGTICFMDGGLTYPWDMPLAVDYLSGRTGTRLEASWSVPGVTTPGLRIQARNAIRDRNTPAVIGTGFAPAHYEVAYGYRYRYRLVSKTGLFGSYTATEYQRQFRTNRGFGSQSATEPRARWAWMPADTWFVGEIRP